MTASSPPLDTAPTGRRYALPLLLLGALAIAFSPLFVRVSEVGPIATGFWRVTLALPVLALWAGLGPARPAQRLPGWRDWGLLVGAGACLSGDLMLWHVSIKHTSIANSTLLANCAPIFVTLASWAIWGERFSLGFLAGLVLAMAGAVMLMGGGAELGFHHLLGDGLALGAAGFYATYLIVVTRARSCFSATTLMLGTSLSAALILLPIALATEGSIASPTLHGWIMLAGLAWISHAAGQGMITSAVAHLPAALSSIALLVQPAGAAILAWILFGEALAPLQMLGALVILGGILQSKRSSK